MQLAIDFVLGVLVLMLSVAFLLHITDERRHR
jgi:hypothetical protein